MSDPSSRGRNFIEQAETQLEQKKLDPSLDFLQGLLMLYAYESRIGDTVKAKAHVELMFETYQLIDFNEVEVGREMDASDLESSRVFQAKSRVIWGLYMLDWYGENILPHECLLERNNADSR